MFKVNKGPKPSRSFRVQFSKELIGVAISISALLISCLTAFFSYKTERRDNLYKEIMIKPAIHITRNTRDLSWLITNDGLGPAIIKRIKYYYKNKCVDSIKNINFAVEENVMIEELIDDVRYYIQAQHQKINLQPNLDTKAMTNSTREGLIVRPGTIVALLEMSVTLGSYAFDDIPPKETRKLDRSVVMRSFNEAVFKYSVEIDYCSMTEFYCSKALFGSVDPCKQSG